MIGRDQCMKQGSLCTSIAIAQITNVLKLFNSRRDEILFFVKRLWEDSNEEEFLTTSPVSFQGWRKYNCRLKFSTNNFFQGSLLGGQCFLFMVSFQYKTFLNGRGVTVSEFMKKSI